MPQGMLAYRIGAIFSLSCFTQLVLIVSQLIGFTQFLLVSFIYAVQLIQLFQFIQIFQLIGLLNLKLIWYDFIKGICQIISEYLNAHLTIFIFLSIFKILSVFEEIVPKFITSLLIECMLDPFSWFNEESNGFSKTIRICTWRNLSLDLINYFLI